MKPYRVIITGDANLPYEEVKHHINNHIEMKQASLLDPAFKITTIITRGFNQTIDQHAQRYAKENKIANVVYSDKWDRKYDPAAMASLRDIEMSKYADALIVFCGPTNVIKPIVGLQDNLLDKSINHIIDIMEEQKKEVHIVQPGTLVWPIDKPGSLSRGTE